MLLLYSQLSRSIRSVLFATTHKNKHSFSKKGKATVTLTITGFAAFSLGLSSAWAKQYDNAKYVFTPYSTSSTTLNSDNIGIVKSSSNTQAQQKQSSGKYVFTPYESASSTTTSLAYNKVNTTANHTADTKSHTANIITNRTTNTAYNTDSTNNTATNNTSINNTGYNYQYTVPTQQTQTAQTTDTTDNLLINNQASSNPNPSLTTAKTTNKKFVYTPYSSDTSGIDDTNNAKSTFVQANSNTQKSLATLEEYYNPINAPTQKELLSQTADKIASIDKNATVEQKYYQAKQAYSDMTNAPRCEGMWVYPTAENTFKDGNGNPYSGKDNEGNPVPYDYLHAQADYGYYDNDKYAELSGNVVVNQAGQLIKADKVTLDLATNVANAEGQVLFTDGGVPGVNTNATNNTTNNATNNSTSNRSSVNSLKEGNSSGLIGVAENLNYDPNSKQANAQDVAFASVPMQAYGYAQQMHKASDTEFNLQKVMFTTCAPNKRIWHLDAGKIDLDTETGRGEAYNTTLNIKDVPIIWLPYFNFPIDDRRTSGFLTPNASYSTERGFEINLPYYLNLAPNYDATVGARVFTNRNPMATTEFRYLTDDYGDGRIVGSYLAKDRKYDDEDRSSLFYEHYWQSETIPHLTADVEYNYVSDADYIDEFDSLNNNIDNEANLPRRAKVNYYNDYVDAELKIETYQELEAEDSFGDPITDADRPYSKLPQFRVDYTFPGYSNKEGEAQFGDLVITGSHDSGYFKKSIDDGSAVEKSGFRMYNKLSASYPMTRPWGYITPELSLQHIFASYDEDTKQANDITSSDGSDSVFVPQFSLDAGLNYYQKGAPFDWLKDQGGYQLLSPRVKYVYAPYKDQSGLPNFNTSVASMSYDQLYADSWFLGHDRLQDLHAITPGVNYRYIDATGRTRFDASMAQQFYLDSGDVSLDDLSDDYTDSQLFNQNSSGLVTSIKAQPINDLWLDVDTALTDDYDLNYITSQLRFQPTTSSQFSLGWMERKENENTNQLPLSAVTASAVMPITNKWRIMAQGQYDTLSNRMLDSIYGVDYEDCCIGFSVYGRHYYNDLDLTGDPEDSVMAEVRLNGLSDNSSRLSKLLSNRIYGYDPVQSSWKKQETK